MLTSIFSDSFFFIFTAMQYLSYRRRLKKYAKKGR